MKIGNFVRNLIVFVVALLLGPYIGGYINSAFGLSLNATTAPIIGYVIAFVIYVFLARWFSAKPSFD